MALIGKGLGISQPTAYRYLDTVFLPFSVTVRRSCATWAAPANSIQASASAP